MTFGYLPVRECKDRLVGSMKTLTAKGVAGVGYSGLPSN